MVCINAPESGMVYNIRQSRLGSRAESVRFHLQSESGVVVPQQMMIRDAGDCHQLAALAHYLWHISRRRRSALEQEAHLANAVALEVFIANGSIGAKPFGSLDANKGS